MSEQNNEKKNKIYKELFEKYFTNIFENEFEKSYKKTLKECKEESQFEDEKKKKDCSEIMEKEIYFDVLAEIKDEYDSKFYEINEKDFKVKDSESLINIHYNKIYNSISEKLMKIISNKIKENINKIIQKIFEQKKGNENYEEKEDENEKIIYQETAQTLDQKEKSKNEKNKEEKKDKVSLGINIGSLNSIFNIW